MKSKELKELESLERIAKIGFIVVVIICVIGFVIMWKEMKSNYRNPFVGCTIEEAKVNPDCTLLYSENPNAKLNIINDEEEIEDKEGSSGLHYDMPPPPNKLVVNTEKVNEVLFINPDNTNILIFPDMESFREWEKRVTVEWSNCTYKNGRRFCKIKSE